MTGQRHRTQFLVSSVTKVEENRGLVESEELEALSPAEREQRGA